ncbi:MAG: InlB B-repeat-containing protein, partial [Acidimicrobiia bacterium]
LTVTRAGTGSGTVRSTPAGIKCGTDCTESYASGTSVTLTANVKGGSTFTGWSGACTGTGSCVVSMTAATTVTATFTAAGGSGFI